MEKAPSVAPSYRRSRLTVEATRIVTACVSLVSLLGLSVLSAVPVQAATQTANFANCQAAFNGQTINVASGDDLTITFTTCTTAGAVNLYLGAAPRAVAASVTIAGASFARGTVGSDWKIDATAVGGGALPSGTYTVYYWLGNAGTFPVTYDFEGSFTVIVAAAPSPSSSGDTGSTPAPVHQQFGKPAVGTCDAAQPDGLDWGGAESGGWSESWAQWMHGGSGGAVCSRTLVYTRALGHWTVD